MRLSVLVLTSLLTACWTSAWEPAPPGFSTTHALSEPGGAPVVDLRRRPATWSIPEPAASPAQTPERFVLNGAGPAAGRLAQRVGADWQIALPFRAPSGSDRFPPPGMQVQVDGRPLVWLVGARPYEGWRIGEEGQLLLALETAPAEVIVDYPGLRAREDRLDPRRSGLPPAEFVSFSLTLGEQTREGLLLPRAMEGRWDLRMPLGARLQAAVATVRDPAHDGPTAQVQVRVTDSDNTTHIVAERPVSSDSFLEWEVDLSAWGGQDVQVSLVTLGGDAGLVGFIAHPVIVGAQPASAPLPRRVVWIGLDTTRPDRLGTYGYARPTSPALDAWARKGVVYEDAITPAPRTRPSFRTALTGRRPLDAVGQPTFLARLDEAGFATAGIVANVHLNTRFGFPDGADRWTLDPSAKAETQVDDAMAWLDAHADRDAALFLHIMDPHLAYVPPSDQADRFVRDPAGLPPRFSRGDVYRWMRDGLDERRKAHISDLYDAEIATTDAALERLFNHLEALPGRTVVVVHSDHGEELWEHGGFEHNHSLKPELHNAVMLLRAPELAPRREAGPVALMDLVPTVLEILDLPADGLDGVSVATQAPAERPRDLGHLMYDRERWGVRSGRYSYVLWTASGREEAYDRLADPSEDHDVLDTLSSEIRAQLVRDLGKVHGMDVGPGWRIDVELSEQLVAVDLPTEALDAGVIDPERGRKHRANLAWGERAPVTPAQVAEVRISEDRRRLLLVPGEVGTGILWVRFAEPTAVAGTLRAGGEQIELSEGAEVVAAGVQRLRVRAGVVAVPPPGEAVRMQGSAGDLAVLPAESAILRKLGYLQDTDSP